MSDDNTVFQPHPMRNDPEDYETFLTESLGYLAHALLGHPGPAISPSQVWFNKCYPDHVAVFNANVCIAPNRRIWSGDLDLTEDLRRLAVLATGLDTAVYVLQQCDWHFSDSDETTLIERAVLIVSPDGTVVHAPHIRQDEEGCLRPAQ